MRPEISSDSQESMLATKKYSPAIRITTGLLGLGGVAAIGYEAVQEASLRLDPVFLLMLLAKLFAAYIFFYVTFFGTSPLAFLEKNGDDR
jgi:hypothetical protein